MRLALARAAVPAHERLGLAPPTREGPLAFFGHFKRQRTWALLIGLVNLVGIAYGFYYYQRQFAATPWWLWWLVPDSPLAVLWAQLALVAFWLGRKPGALDVLAVVGNVQVGLWTVYVLTAYRGSFGTFDPAHPSGPLNTVLLFAHAAMALLALIYLDGLRRRHAVEPRAVGLALAIGVGYYLLQDALDYFGPDFLGNGCGMRPYTVPCVPSMEPALAAVTFALTLAGGALVVTAVRRRRG